MEKWKPIKGYEDFYEVSNCGKIKSHDRVIEKESANGSKYKTVVKGRVLKPFYSQKGYQTVDLRVNGKRKTIFVHKLVALHFLPAPKPEQTTVNHKDGDKENNHISNLEWMTLKENMDHAYKNGLKFTRYSDETVLKIRKLFATGKYTKRQVADMCGVNERYVWKIVNNQRRRLVKEEA